MKYQLVIKKSVQKSLKGLERQTQVQVEEKLAQIIENPYNGKALIGVHQGLYSWRAWPYRIIYFIAEEQNTIVVVQIGHRKDIYRKLKL